MLPLAAEMQKVLYLAYYSVKLKSNSILNGRICLKQVFRILLRLGYWRKTLVF